MSLSLGVTAEPLFVTLNEHADFICTLESRDGDWPDAAFVRLEFADGEATVWAATVEGPALTWNVDKLLVDDLIGRLDTSAKRHVRLSYADGSADLPWAQGTVVIVRWGA